MLARHSEQVVLNGDGGDEATTARPNETPRVKATQATLIASAQLWSREVLFLIHTFVLSLSRSHSQLTN